MQINIDTSKDSNDDIKKVIAFLQHFIDEGTEGPIPETSEGIFNLFDDSSSDSTDSDSTSMYDFDNLPDNDSDDDTEDNDEPEKIEIVPYG